MSILYPSMKSFGQIVDRWPSRQVFVSDLGVEEETVRGWVRRDSVPSGYWKRLLKAARKRRIKITPELLIDLADRG